MQLKDLQKYRNTILLMAIFLSIGIILAVVTYGGSNSKETLVPPPQIPTAAFSSFDPKALSIQWDKVGINRTKEEISAVLGSPAKEEKKDNNEIVKYTTTTPGAFHTVTYNKNKAIRIDRFVNDRQELISPAFYQANFGNPEILHTQEEPGDYQKESYKTRASEYTVITVDTQFNAIYEISIMTNDQYNILKKELEKKPEFVKHGDIEPWP
ncbi:MAG: hypothetical protein M3Q44_01175 [bacterium]|nr:hypothetical protein [bacterium]